MSGSSGVENCVRCGGEGTVQTYSDWKPHDYVSGTCIQCGYDYHTITGMQTLEEVNELRKELELEPLTELVKPTDEWLARIIWIAIKRNHVVNQYFNKNCLVLAKELRKKKWANITGGELNSMLRNLGMLGSEEYMVGDEILPFVNGEKGFELSIKIKVEKK